MIKQTHLQKVKEQFKVLKVRLKMQRKVKILNNVSLLIENRNDYNDGYNNYGEDTDRIDALGKTFPILFFIIAILVSFTTMRRMVEENV